MRPTPDPDRVQVFGHLQALLLSMADVDTFLSDLAQLATTVVTVPASCGITVRYDGNLMTVGSSDERAEQLDETQYRTGQGPCLDSVRTGRIFEVTDAATDQRWPAYLPRAIDLGLRCSLSLPLTVGSDTLGAMNVYGFEQPSVFGTQERRALELFAAQAAGTLRLATRQLKDSTLMKQMEEALTSRTVIDQALGIIMAQQGCAATTAFDLLRRESQNSRRRLRDIAADLVARISGDEPGPGRPFTT